MPNTFNFNNITKGQQLIIFFNNNKTLIFKTENASQGTRFVVFGETLEGEKVLIPAFTGAELDTKYRNVNDSRSRLNNCTKWISKRWFGVTSRFLDVEEIYLLNSEGNLRKYDGAFDGKVCFEKSQFYVSEEATYNFNDIKLFFLKARVRNILLKNNRGKLPIDENVSLIQQALARIGEDSQLDTARLLTMKERVTLFIEAINQIPEAIDLFVYYQESEDKKILDINDVILQSELLHKLNIKTGLNFTKEELTKFKIKLEVIENNEDEDDNILKVQLNLAYKVDNNTWSANFSSSEFQIKAKRKNKVSLLFNLHCGKLSMISVKWMSIQEKEASFFSKLDFEIKKIDNVIEEFIKLSNEDKRTVNALLQTQQQWEKNIADWKNEKELSDTERLAGINKDKKELENVTKKIEEILFKNEEHKQKTLNSLLIDMKLVNNLQMLSYLQKSLFLKSKEYLIASDVFYQVHNSFTLLSMQNIERYVKSKNPDNISPPIGSIAEIDNLLNDNFSEFVEIYKLLPIEFQSRPVYIVSKLLNLLDNFKKIEMSKLLGQEIIIDEEHMAKVYLSLLNFSDYEGSFSQFVWLTNDLEIKLSKSVKNSKEFKVYKQELEDLRVKFWKSYDFTTLINELVNVYFPSEKQEILPKFSLEEHFLLEEQILQTNILKDNDSHNIAKLKLMKANNILKINQKLSEGFQKELSDAFQISEERAKINLGKWEVNDIIAVNSLVNIDGIKENELVYFKVLQKNRDNFTVIIQYLNSKKTWDYKIRDITINNCKSFNFTFSKENLNFPSQEEIIDSQTLINDYITWKDKTIPEYVLLLLQKLKKINDPILGFVKVNNQNSFNYWEWEINLQKIKEKLLEIIDKEIMNDKQLIEEGQLTHLERLRNNEDLRYVISNNILTFDFTENSKEKIKSLKENVNKTSVIFDISYHSNFLGNYKKQTSAINFKINRDSSIAKKRLAAIKEEVSKIRNSLVVVNSKIRTVTNDLHDLHNSILNLLQTKKQEWETLSNHTNLNVQFQNQRVIAKLKLDIEQLNEQLVNIKDKIFKLSAQKVQNSLFYNDYITFIRYYDRVTEDTPSDMKKYLYWDKNYQIIKNKLKIYSGYNNFDHYETVSLNKINNIKDIDIENCKKSLVELSKTKFKKLSWWQKIINKISWTWKKTKIAIKTVKENNTKNFGTLIANLNDNKTSIDEISVPYQRQSISELLPTSEPWDEWIIEKKPKLSRSNSTDSAISWLSSEFEENDYSIIDNDKILRELNSYSFPQYSDLESSTESSRQEFNHCLTRTASSDSGICSGQITPKPVSTNPFDDESDDEELAGNTINESNNLVNTVPLPSKSTSKLNFS